MNTGNVGPHEIPNVWILGIDKREDFRSMEQNLQKYDKRKKNPQTNERLNFYKYGKPTEHRVDKNRIKNTHSISQFNCKVYRTKKKI